MSTPSHLHIAIVGSGFSGLGMAIKLKQGGEHDFAVFERAGDIGGTWRDNSYPGCACDVESHLYSFSFALNPKWTRMYSPQPEIWEYLKDTANHYGLMPHVRLNHELISALWSDQKKIWQLQTSKGEFTADILIAGMGALSEPSVPKLPGIESFRGKSFHSAQWDHDYDLVGKNIAVIGTGASAIQFVPLIQPKVQKLSLFQRTPPWVMPNLDRSTTEKERGLFQKFPFVQKLFRLRIYLFREFFGLGFRHPRLMKYYTKIAIRHMARAIKDPALREKLTPRYKLGCKRILMSNTYYPALTKPNVDIITNTIKEIKEHSIITKDRSGHEMEHAVDTIIYGTGFQVTEMPFSKRVFGKAGRALSEIWHGSPEAFWGTSVADFPNLFVLLGPNTGLGHNSVVLMIEAQIALVMKALRYMKKKNAAAIEARPEMQASFNVRIQKKLKGTVWDTGGCASWYIDKTGKNTTLWPSSVIAFRHRARRFKPAGYVMTPQMEAETCPILPEMLTETSKS